MDKLSHKVFYDHPMNQLMTEAGGLPVYDPVELALKPMKLTQSGQLPTDEQVEAVRTGVIEFCKTVHGGAELEADIQGINKTWPVMRSRFASNLGLTQLMLDCGAKSRYFYQYLYHTGLKHFAVALEAKDGYALPVSGKLEFERVPDGDWCQIVCVEEPSHPARRQTDWRPQSILRNAEYVFEGGAGLMPAYRNYGYPLGKLGQRIVACDSDPEILQFFEMAFGAKPEDLGIEYVVGDLMEVMDNPDYFGQFEVARMTGLLSYFPEMADKKVIMQKAKRLLRPGGLIVGDLWVMGASLARSAYTTIWPMDPTDPHRLTPAANEEAAMNDIKALCDDVGLPFACVSDVCNGNPNCHTQVNAKPKCVMFVAGEGASESLFDAVPIAGSPYDVDAV